MSSTLSRKPVKYDLPASDPDASLVQELNADSISSLPTFTRFRSLTDLSFTSSAKQPGPMLPSHLQLHSHISQNPQDQLERVRRLTVDDAEMVLHAAQLSAARDDGNQRRKRGSYRGTGRFGHFSFKFKPRKHFSLTENNPLNVLKSTASKIYNKLNFMKQKTDEFTTVSPLIISDPAPVGGISRSHSVTGSFVMPPRKLVRQPSISSFNSIATAPEYMYSTSSSSSSIMGTRDIPRKPAPQRPASMIAPAAEHVFARDVLGPMPRSAKVLGPRLSDCQTLRVSGHVRQTYTRTLQRGNLESRGRALPAKPLPETPENKPATQPDAGTMLATPMENVTQRVLVQEPTSTEVEEEEPISTQVEKEEEEGNKEEKVVAENSCLEVPSPTKSNDELQDDSCLDLDGPGDVSGTDEFFDASDKNKADDDDDDEGEEVQAQKEEVSAFEAGKCGVEQVPCETQTLQTAHGQLLVSLDDKLNSLQANADTDCMAVEKTLIVECNPGNNGIKENNDLPSKEDGVKISIMERTSDILPGTEAELLAVLTKMEEYLVKSEHKSAALVPEMKQPTETTAEESNEITNTSDALFQLLNKSGVANVSQSGLDEKMKPTERVEAARVISITKTTEPEKEAVTRPEVDMKRKFQELRAKFNQNLNSSPGEGAMKVNAGASRWFKKAPPPPPVNIGEKPISPFGDCSNIIATSIEAATVDSKIEGKEQSSCNSKENQIWQEKSYGYI
ncbi:hypothetical protein BDR26DRAFT_858708 [Obelidium mucronatum]|nr:hypothetical protein BDR26DRAFT_858708 [Obelidium mucronatum]